MGTLPLWYSSRAGGDVPTLASHRSRTALYRWCVDQQGGRASSRAYNGNRPIVRTMTASSAVPRKLAHCRLLSGSGGIATSGDPPSYCTYNIPFSRARRSMLRFTPFSPACQHAWDGAPHNYSARGWGRWLVSPSPPDEPRLLGSEEARATPCGGKLATARRIPSHGVWHQERIGSASLPSAEAQITLGRLKWAATSMRAAGAPPQRDGNNGSLAALPVVDAERQGKEIRARRR
jgi:hypothetical protein